MTTLLVSMLACCQFGRSNLLIVADCPINKKRASCREIGQKASKHEGRRITKGKAGCLGLDFQWNVDMHAWISSLCSFLWLSRHLRSFSLRLCFVAWCPSSARVWPSTSCQTSPPSSACVWSQALGHQG